MACSSQERTAEESEAFLRVRVGGDVDAGGVALGAPQAQQRRVQEALPGMRADGVAEQRVVVSALQAVMAAVLLVGPAGGQVGDRLDIVIDDRVVAHGRAEHAEAVRAQAGDQGGEPIPRDDRRFVRHGARVGGIAGACIDPAQSWRRQTSPAGAGEVKMQSSEVTGDRVALLYQLTCRPDHPHPRAHAPSTSPAPAGEAITRGKD